MSDLISRQAAIDAIRKDIMGGLNYEGILKRLPSVHAEPMQWIPVTYRPMTDEEKKDYAERTGYDEDDFDTMLACPLPDDGETVLVTDRYGNVETDTFCNDCDGCYFECNCDMDDVKAWMRLPKAYSESEEQA